MWLVGQCSAALRKSLDLVGDVSARRNRGITGKTRLELKAYADGGFERKIRKRKRITMEEDFKVINTGSAKYKAAMLLVSKRPKKVAHGRGQPRLRRS